MIKRLKNSLQRLFKKKEAESDNDDFFSIEQRNKAGIKEILKEKKKKTLEELIKELKEELRLSLAYSAELKASLIRVNIEIESKQKLKTQLKNTTRLQDLENEINLLLDHKERLEPFCNEKEKWIDTMRKLLYSYENESRFLRGKIALLKTEIRVNNLSSQIESKKRSLIEELLNLIEVDNITKDK